MHNSLKFFTLCVAFLIVNQNGHRAYIESNTDLYLYSVS